MTEEFRELIGYESRLWKMTRQRLAQEAAKFAIVVDRTTPKSLTIARILEAQGFDDNILINPPPRRDQ